jgi:hypothetical protein
MEWAANLFFADHKIPLWVQITFSICRARTDR